MSALERYEEIQTNGLVGVFYFTGYTMEDRKKKPQSSQLPRQAYLIRDGIPFRVAGLHWCLDDPRIHTVLSLFRTLAGTNYRLRFRDHFGKFSIVCFVFLS